MTIVRKLALNFGWQALRVLGPYTYLRYLFNFFCNLGSIVRAGDFKPLDRAMGKRPIKARMNGSDFIIDCPYTDSHIVDGTFTFGIMRELYIRNCYLRYGVAQAAINARTVLDLGANRGTFSVMMARRAKLVIAVDLNPIFRDVIARNMAVNGFKNYQIETVLVGKGGLADEGQTSRIWIPELMQKHGLESVDLVKMDIDGAEYAIFQSPEWLTRVSAFCMEVHPQYGDPQEILTALKRYGFETAVTDVFNRHAHDLKQASYIYGWKSGSENKHVSEG